MVKTFSTLLLMTWASITFSYVYFYCDKEIKYSRDVLNMLTKHYITTLEYYDNKLEKHKKEMEILQSTNYKCEE